MSKNRRKAPRSRQAAASAVVESNVASTAPAVLPLDVQSSYAEACRLASLGENQEARRIYAALESSLASAKTDGRLRALVRNDLAVMAAMEGRFDEAHAGWQAALAIDHDCLTARLNCDLIEAEAAFRQATEDFGELKLAAAPGQAHPEHYIDTAGGCVQANAAAGPAVTKPRNLVTNGEEAC
jgi:putative heme degradation protein